MKCIADLSVTPIGDGVSVSEQVTQCERILQSFPIETHLHAYGTNLYGEWDDVFAAVKACHEHLHKQGTVRVNSSIRVGTRTDKDQTLTDRVTAVQERMRAE